MIVKDSPVFGAHCRIVWAPGKSSVSVSITPSEEDRAGPVSFGALAYALPYRGEETIVSVLIPSEDQMAVDCASRVSQMLAAMFQKPVFVNTPLRVMDSMLFGDLKDFAQELIASN